jgi:hypothetical protein
MRASTWRLLLRPAFDADTETSCGTSVAEAREAHAFWRRRLKRLPWYRRAARAEAREMAARWQRRMLHAQLERWRLAALAGPVLALLERAPARTVAARQVARQIVRVSPAARMVAVAATAVTVTALAILVLVVVAIAQLV